MGWRAGGANQATSARLRREANEGFSEWLSSALEKGAGPAHRWTAQGTGLPGALEVVWDDDDWQVEPVKVMQWRVRKWEAIWAPACADQGALIEKLRVDALADRAVQPRAPITLDELDRALASFKVTTSSCSYGVSPSHPRLFSVEARRRLLVVLHAVEAVMLLPALDALQLLLFLGKLAGGERPVSSMGFVLRLWSRVRGDAIQAWDSAHWRFWDSAVNGVVGLAGSPPPKLLE